MPQAQPTLLHLIDLRQHGNARLLQGVVAVHGGVFSREISILNT